MKVFIFCIVVIIYILIGTGFYYTAKGNDPSVEFTSQEIIYIVLFWPIEFIALIAITIKILINRKKNNK